MKRILISLLVCSACTSTPPPISISTAISGIAADLKNVGAISVANASQWDNSQFTEFDQQVQRSQCYYHSSNPIIPLILHDINLTLTGNFSSNGSFTLASPSPYTPIASMVVGNSSEREQTIALPVTFTALANLPATMQAQHATADDVKVLQQQTDQLIVNFDPASCQANAATTVIMLKQQQK